MPKLPFIWRHGEPPAESIRGSRFFTKATDYCLEVFWGRYRGDWDATYQRWSTTLGIPDLDRNAWADSCRRNPGFDELGNYMTYNAPVCFAALGHFTVEQAQRAHYITSEVNPVMYAWGQYFAATAPPPPPQVSPPPEAVNATCTVSKRAHNRAIVATSTGLRRQEKHQQVHAMPSPVTRRTPDVVNSGCGLTYVCALWSTHARKLDDSPCCSPCTAGSEFAASTTAVIETAGTCLCPEAYMTHARAFVIVVVRTPSLCAEPCPSVQLLLPNHPLCCQVRIYIYAHY
jgi:hypothetical protein